MRKGFHSWDCIGFNNQSASESGTNSSNLPLKTREEDKEGGTEEVTASLVAAKTHLVYAVAAQV